MDDRPNSRWGVICDECGPQGLTEDQYDQQMASAWVTWRCPNCDGHAEWDDDRYELNQKEEE